MAHSVKSRLFFFAFLLIALFALPAAADNVTISGNVTFASLDGSVADHDHTVNGVFTVNDGNLTIQGSVNCNDTGAGSGSACSMAFATSGNFTMTAGSTLYAENRVGGGNGGNITVTAGGSVTLQGPSGSLAGAQISSSRFVAGGPNNHAGDITITAGGVTSLQPGTIIAAGAGDGTAGTVSITGQGVMTIGGLVSAGPTSTVSSATKYTGDVLSGGVSGMVGGTIRLVSSSHDQPAITVTSDAIVVTQGANNGTGSVTIEGCDLRINGLVASLSRDGAGARVDIRSGTSITVDGRDVNRSGPTSGRFGVIRADSTFNGTTGAMRADLFAQNDITIYGPEAALSSVSGVSANGNTSSKDVAGVIRVISTAGAVTANGNAFAASGTLGGDDGGSINVLSRNNATLDNAVIKANGDFTSTDPARSGGSINVRSYSGAVSWQSGIGDVRPTGTASGVPVTQQGTITLTYCSSVAASGSAFPTNGPAAGTFPTIVNSCSPAAPALPAGEPVLPTCNRPPVAVNDAYTVAEGGTLSVPAPGVLTNDSDPDGDPITAVLVSGPAHASSFVLNANGSFNYVHDGSETTSDSFTYRASDGASTSNLATVNITVTPVNDVPVANNDNATVAEGGTINMAASGVLANDTDPDGPNALTTILVTGPAHASSFALNPDGSYTYVHDGSETTSDSFTYKASDGVATSNTATVSITITPVNDAPVANNDTYSVAEGGTLNQSAPGVLGNDTDPDSPALTAVLVSGPSHASSFTLNSVGSFTYVHDGSETLTDSFTYRANDGSLNSNIATVNITITPVNDAPVAVNDGPYNVAEGGTLNAAAPGVLGNDTDVDSPTLTAVLVSGPAHASSFALNANGSFTYVHDGSETTTDSFTYRANDGSLNSNIATVTITITPVNDAPVAANDTYSVAEGGTLNQAAPGVLGNDTDVDSPVLTSNLVSGPAHAAAFSLNPDGSFTYVHDGSETTTDSFTYRANDGLANSNIATVTITISPVNDAPVAVSDNYAVNEGGTINAIAPGVLGNDTDADSPALTAVLVSGPTHASSFALNADGSFTYVHDGSETTSDVFTYKVSDGSAFSNIATVTISIALVNDAPAVTAGGALTFTEGDAATVIDNTITISDSDSSNLVGATVAISGNYANGQDVLGFTNTANITGTFNAVTGTLTLTGSDTVANYQAALRSVTYNNTSGSPSTLQRTVTWQVDDGAGMNNLSAPVTSTIKVVSTNDAPQLANGSTITYTENDAATAVNSVINATDTDSANLTGATVQITTGYNSGQDVLSFAPMLGITGSFNSGTATLTLSGTSSVANYQAALRSVKYTNTSEDPATASRTVVFQVTDGTDLSNTVNSTINVTAVNDAPTALAFSGLPAQAGIPITYPAGKLGGSDVEAGTTVTIDTTPINLVNGSVTLNANGSFTFTPVPQSAGGTASFQYRVFDNGNPAPGVNSAYVTVSFNVAGPAIYFVNAAGAGNCTLGNECTLTTALAFGAANANIFISDAATHSNGPITLNSGGSIIGQGIVAPSFDALFGILAPAQGTLAPRPAVNQARPAISNSPITLGTNSTAAGFNMSNNSGDTLIASSKSGLLVKDMDVSSTATTSSDYAVRLTNSSGTFAFGNITVPGGAGGNGVNFSGTTSASPVTFGNVSTTSGDAVTIATSGATNFSFNDATSTTGKAVGITGGTGSMTFHAVNANGGSNGVTIGGNYAGAFTVTGTSSTAGSGGTIQNMSGRGIEVLGAASPAAQPSVSIKNMNLSNNALTSGDAVTTNCGASSASGANANCGAAVHLNNVNGASFDTVAISGSGQNGINGLNVIDLRILNSSVQNCGNATGESGVFVQNLTGLNTALTNSIFSGNFDWQFAFVNWTSGALGNAGNPFNVSNCTFTGTGNAISGDDGFRGRVRGTSTANISIGGGGNGPSHFRSNFSFGAFLDAADTGSLTFTIKGCDFGTLGNAATYNNSGIGTAISGGSSTNYTIQNNTIIGSASGTPGNGTAILVSNGLTSAGSSIVGTISGNIIGNAATSGSGCTGGCNGISLFANGGGPMTFNASVTSNQIHQVSAFGMQYIGGTTTGAVAGTLHINSNTFDSPEGGLAFGQAIIVQAAASGAGGAVSTMCADIGNGGANSISGVWDGGNGDTIRLTTLRGSIFTIGAMPPDPNAATATVNAYVSSQNGGTVVTSSKTGSGGGTFNSNGAVCP
jgi:VCBS repeat-containing protein